MKLVRSASRIVALVLTAGLPAVGLAQTAPAPATVAATTMAPHHVTTPHPDQGVAPATRSETSTYSGGYAPAYYPGGCLLGLAVSVYGYNYYSYPVQGNRR